MNASRPNPVVLLALALAGLLALPASSMAEYYVPPGNSAANQYTESFPSAGGETGGSHGGKATPAKTLGDKNARKLDDQGPVGRAAAQLAAETAPNGLHPTGSGAGAGRRLPAGSGREHGGNGTLESTGGSTTGPGGSTAGSNRSRQVADAVARSEQGGSGIGRVVSQATGTTGGNLGPLLPLMILAIAAAAIGYGWRERHRPTI